ncbi:C-Myc-binding protein isoform 1-T1 [Chlamydotis macqueenii]
MAHYKAADSKREQFRRYLEKSGVLDTLTKVLVALYEEPEKPNSALDFLKHHLGASAPENPEVEALRLEVAEMKEKYEAVLEENKKLKTKVPCVCWKRMAAVKCEQPYGLFPGRQSPHHSSGRRNSWALPLCISHPECLLAVLVILLLLCYPLWLNMNHLKTRSMVNNSSFSFML